MFVLREQFQPLNIRQKSTCVWCLMVLLYELKLCIATPSPVTSPVTHLHKTAANWRSQLIIPGLPKISHAGAKGFQIPAVIITRRAGRQVIIVSWNKEVCLNWEVKEDTGNKTLEETETKHFLYYSVLELVHLILSQNTFFWHSLAFLFFRAQWLMNGMWNWLICPARFPCPPPHCAPPSVRYCTPSQPCSSYRALQFSCRLFRSVNYYDT